MGYHCDIINIVWATPQISVVLGCINKTELLFKSCNTDTELKLLCM